MSAQWIRCPGCQVAIQVGPSGPQKCGACGADLIPPSSWYLVVNKQKVGPLPLSQLQQMSQGGQLKADDMVLQEGSQKWTPAGSVAGLFQTVVRETVGDSWRTATYAGGVTTAPLPPSATPIPAIPGYEILGELGRGGMGVVYKARQTSLKRIVALKMILSGGHAGWAELTRFRGEAEAVARLQHPNIVQIYEIGEKDGLPYFSLEYVAGGTLAKRLGGTPLPARDAASLTATLALAIDFAHQAGIVHRDLKPANILLAASGLASDAKPQAAFVPKISDFGLAKTLDDDAGQTRTGAIVGTPSYMSPEQAAGQTKTIGPAADVYALGAILYECLTGRPPFRAATVLETLEQVRSQEPVSPRSLQPGLPRDVETICLKCLAKDPAKRYATAKDLADDLGRYLRHEPIQARPASVQERAIKYVKRNRLLVGSAAAVFLTMLIAIISTSVSAAQARRSELDEKKAAQEAKDNLQNYRASDRERLVQSARRASQRGQTNEAIQLYQEALSALEPDDPRRPELRFEIAYGHASLYRVKEAREILDDLLQDPNLGDLEGSVLLLKGYATMEGQVTEGVAMIEKALRLKLPPAQRSFAQGLLASTSEEAVKHFSEAIDKDPYHLQSRLLLSLVQLMLGRMADARDVIHATALLYPDDANVILIRSLMLGQQGKIKEATRSLEKIRGAVTPRQYRVLETVLELLDLGRQIDDPDRQFDQVRLLTLWAKIAKDADSVWPALPGRVSRVPEEGTSQMMSLPPVLNKSLGQVIEAFAQVMLNLESDDAHHKLERVLRSHPEGTLYYIHGTILYSRKRYAEARLQLLTSLRVPTLFPLRRSILLAMITCDGELALLRGKNDPEILKAGIEDIRELLKLGPIRSMEAELCAKIALNAKELELARLVVRDWQNEVGPDLPALQVVTMQIEAQSGNHAGAIEAADRVLARNPNHEAARKIRSEAVQNLLALAKKVGG